MAHEVESQIRNALSIDVEEYFHPTELAQSVRPDEWPYLPSFVEMQTMLVLDMLAQHGVSGTFFVLGWVAEHHPQIVRQIRQAGHEIGCHSYLHSLVYDLTPSQFREDTRRAVTAIADACGIIPRLYRAPSYSITKRSLWALEILAEFGFTHDSSIYPIQHDRYGIPGFVRGPQALTTRTGKILEVPIATAALSRGRIVPVGGGGYLRLLPYSYTAAGLRRRNRTEGAPACVYFHPWELDPNFPRLRSGRLSRLRTYSGLKGMRSKLDQLLNDFKFARLTDVFPYAANQWEAEAHHLCGGEESSMKSNRTQLSITRL